MPIHPWIRDRARALALCGVLVTCGSPARAATPELTIADGELSVAGNNKITLTRVETRVDTARERSGLLTQAPTQPDGYTVGLRSIKEPSDKQQFFEYEFEVRSVDTTVAPVLVLFNVRNTGRFDDFTQRVPFTVKANGKEFKGAIDLFFPSLEPTPVCVPVGLPTRADPQKVYSSGSTPIAVRLDCAKAAAIPRFTEVSALHGRHKDYWAPMEVASPYTGANAKTPNGKDFELFSASVTPNVWKTVGARFRRDGPDDTLVAEFDYTVPPAGLPRRLTVDIPIVFYPFVEVIAGLLLAGVFTGWFGVLLLTFIANKRKPWSVAFAALGLGVVVALGIYLVDFLAWTAKSKVTLLDLDSNPSDPVVIFIIGFLGGCLALLNADDLLTLVQNAGKKILPQKAVAAGLALLCLGLPIEASSQAFSLIALSACPDGNVVGLDRNGTVIQFSGESPGRWRNAGKLANSLRPAELSCAMLAQRETAFIVARNPQWFVAVTMDMASGSWTSRYVAPGVGGGIAFDAASGTLLVSSTKDRMIYAMPPGEKNAKQWATVYGQSASIGALAMDAGGKSLLVGEAFDGIVHAFSLDDQRQRTAADGFGTVNSLSVDARKNLLYVADSSKRAVWSVSLGPAKAAKKRKPFYQADDLKYLTGVAADTRSRVWLSLDKPGKVVVLDPAGKIVTTIQ